MKVSQSSRVMIRGLTSGMFSLLEFSPDQAWWSTAENYKLFLAGHSVGWMKVQGWQPWQLVTRLYKIIAALKTYSRAAEILNNKWYNDGVSCVSRPWVQSREARGERRPASAAQFKYSHSFSPEQHQAGTESTTSLTTAVRELLI